MRYIDLTRPITPDMPLYPGTKPPVVHHMRDIEKDHFRETALAWSSHVGTHIDAPAHMLADGATLDTLPPERFFGTAAVVDCADAIDHGFIGEAHILRAADRLAGVDFALLHTGHDRLWPSPAYAAASPALTEDAARRLVALGIRGVGIDALSVDPVGFMPQPAHLVLLGAGMIIIENLWGLERLGEARCLLTALPLLYPDADGAPCRAVARVE